MAAITAPNNDTVTFRFDAGGRLTEKLQPNGVSARYQYNADDSLKQVINRTTASTILSQHDYSYDGTGNRATQIEKVGAATTNYAYSYDELQRLTQVTNGTAAQQETYSYDPLNNRTLKSLGNPVTSTLAYKYDAANELTEIHSGSLAGPLLNTLTYDTNGNLSNDGTRTYTWDAINQLSQVSNGGTTVAYGYDSEGRRTHKTIAGTTTSWLYDGQNIYAEYASGWTTATALYTQAGTDYPISRTVLSGGAFGQAQYYHSDGLGSIVGLSNNSDSTTQTERFDAWGNKLSGTITQTAQYGYTGREPDETGIVYYRARYYSPTLGRFVSRDPIGLNGGINQYAYVNDNPINFNDPNGLLAQMVVNTASYYGGQATDWVSQNSQSLANAAHVGLTGASFCPSICGSAFSVIDAGVYAAQGDNTSAGISLGAAALGIVSDAGAAKLAGLGLKAGADALDVANAAKGGASIIENGARGRAFESSVIDALGATKNTSGVAVSGLGTSIPDIMGGGSITEIKDV